MPGELHDDTPQFTRAYELSLLGSGTDVMHLSQEVSADQYNEIVATMNQHMDTKVPSGFDYRFPMRDENKNPLPMPPNCNNCATYPGVLGLQIPENTGQLRGYWWPKFLEMGAQPWTPPQLISGE